MNIKAATKLSYEETHRNINGFIEKMCNQCFDWFPMTNEHFYKNKMNKTDGLSPWCKKCAVRKSLQWRVDNREQWLEQNKKINSRPDRKEEIKSRKKVLRAAGQEREWMRNNPDKLKEYRENRQHKNHDITDRQWDNCKNYFKDDQGNQCCAYCGMTLEKHYDIIGTDFHKEHVIYNGLNDLSNCVPSCKNCNSQKWEFLLDDWYNENNFIYTKERFDKIQKWVSEDYKQYVDNV